VDALCRQGKELGEEVSRLHGPRDDGKESDLSSSGTLWAQAEPKDQALSVPTSLGNGDMMAKAGRS